jgi:putative salt-induced outer membrane protein YdiY
MLHSLLLLMLLVGDGTDPAASSEDRLLLGDGSILVGTIVQLEEGQYTVEVAGIGKVKVPADRVIGAFFTSGGNLVTDADEVLSGPLQLVDGNWLIVNSLGQRSVPNSRVISINPTPTESYQKATITLNGIKTSGNTRTISASMNLDYTFRYKTHRFVSKVNWAYGEDETVLSKRTTGAEIKYDFFPHDEWYLYTSFSARNDQFADLSLRTTAGIGAGIQILDSDSISWSQEAGISALNEDFISAEDETASTLRVAGNLSWSIDDGLLEAFHDHTIFVSLVNPDDLLAESRLGIRTRIIGGLSLNAQMNVRHDSQPPIAIQGEDIELLLGLGYSTTF